MVVYTVQLSWLALCMEGLYNSCEFVSVIRIARFPLFDREFYLTFFFFFSAYEHRTAKA